MAINRRTFLASSAVLGTGLSCWALSNGYNSTSGIESAEGLNSKLRPFFGEGLREFSVSQPAFSITPVVADGKWIWNKPPDNETGYLEPRDFAVSTGITITGRGNGLNLRASTVTPVGFPEQEVLDFKTESQACDVAINQLCAGAAQLLLSANSLMAGQSVAAAVHYKLRISKSYQGYSEELFPREQSLVDNFWPQYLKNSPGIKATSTHVKELVGKVVDSSFHPWVQAKKFQEWVFENIEGVPGRYTSVDKAIKNGKGDCEERACVFIAMCRAAGIPARQVWVPSHVWAEIGLHDHEGTPHWIPVHTAAYNWFGWTGAHELILQKGDNIRINHRRKTVRLVDDWCQIRGPRPDVYYSTTITPIAPEGQDSGPGAREKLKTGQWKLVGNHPANQYLRE